MDEYALGISHNPLLGSCFGRIQGIRRYDIVFFNKGVLKRSRKLIYLISRKSRVYSSNGMSVQGFESISILETLLSRLWLPKPCIQQTKTLIFFHHFFHIDPTCFQLGEYFRCEAFEIFWLANYILRSGLCSWTVLRFLLIEFEYFMPSEVDLPRVFLHTPKKSSSHFGATCHRSVCWNEFVRITDFHGTDANLALEELRG